MFKVTNEGDLSFVSKSLCIFSDSSERDFVFRFRAYEGCSLYFFIQDDGIFLPTRFCSLEFDVKFLQDFYIEFNIGDFYFEISNIAHHEEN